MDILSDVSDWDFTSINLWIRIFSRIGFCLVLYAGYRFYKLFASPLVQKQNKRAIIAFAIVILVGFLLLTVDFFIPTLWLASVTMLFNSIVTYILAVYLLTAGSTLKKSHSSAEFKVLADSMDKFILKWKYI